MSPDYGTIGILFIDNLIECFTLENHWYQNKRNISCIPAGVYNCHRYESVKFGDTFIIEDVPDRLGILFHTGNVKTDTEGCILLGRGIGTVYGMRGVTGSIQAFNNFMGKLESVDSFILKIGDMYV